MLHRTPKAKKTALLYAASENHVEVMRLLLAHCPAQQLQMDYGGKTALFDAVVQGHVEAIILLLQTCQQVGLPLSTIEDDTVKG